MAASLGPSWSLRSNASPRCLTAYVTTTQSSSGRPDAVTTTTTGGGGSSSIGGGGGIDSSNPFDDEATTMSSSTAAHHHHQQQYQQQQQYGGAANNAGGYYYVHSVAFGTERGSLHYRQYPPTLVDSDDARIRGGDGGGSVGGGGGGYNRHRGGYHHHERSLDPSQLFIDPESTPDGQINLQGAVKGSIVGIVRATPPPPMSIAAAAAAAASSNNNATTPVFLLLVDDNRGSSSASASSNPGAYAAHLVTIKHGAFNKLPAAPPVAIDGGSNNTISPEKPPLASSISSSRSHRRGGSHASGGAGSGTMSNTWFGNNGGDGTTPMKSIQTISTTPNNNNNNNASSSTNTTTTSAASNTNNMMSLGTLPRMSCVAYHPSTGFVYAAGTGVYGLPNVAVRAVLAGMVAGGTNEGGHYLPHSIAAAGGGGSGRGGASVSSSHSLRQQQRQRAGSVGSAIHHHSNTTTTTSTTTAQLLPSPPMALYLKSSHALPLPGVRCSSGSSNGNSMTLACSGRVAIVAVSNAFYAVPCCLDVGVLKSHVAGGGASVGSGGEGQQHLQQPHSNLGGSSSLPNVSATKILTFAQSSQVHPVIAMEVMTSSSSSSSSGVNNTSSSTDTISRYLRPITSLLFLASGRECTTLEITSIPNSRMVNNIMLNKGGGSSVPLGGGVVSTSIKATASKHGMATLPSPILAAAPLPPSSTRTNTALRGSNYSTIAGSGAAGMSGNNNNSSSSLSSGPMVALLTVDGLVHIRSPFCIAVPLASIEVGTRPNDFFTLCTLPSPSSLPYNNNKYNNAMMGNVGGGSNNSRNIVATSYGGESRLLTIQPETPQDFADRLIKLCIDAFGTNGFPRLELAEALGATFSATSYMNVQGVGLAEEPATSYKRGLLRQYLESVLGLGSYSSGGGGGGGVSFVMLSGEDGQESGLEVEGSGRLVDNPNEGNDSRDNDAINNNTTMPSASSLDANSLLTCTALLCLVCYQLAPAPNGTAACRASKVCASSMGIVRPKDSHPSSSGGGGGVGGGGRISKSAVAVCELVADRLLKEVSTSFSLLTSTSSSAPITSSHNRPGAQGGVASSMEFVESAVWLLRSCGCHEKAIAVLQERMNSPAFRNASVGSGGGIGGGGQTSSHAGGTGGGGGGGSWSQIKFDSYLATHLGELWSSKDDRCCQLVLRSPATKDLIARNPTLGLSVFTTIHPQNETEWKRMKPGDDPLAHPLYPPKVVELLKSVTPHGQQEQSMGSGGGVGIGGVHDQLGMAESFASFSPRSREGSLSGPLPMDSGRALAVLYLESSIGIATGRPPSSSSDSSNNTPASSSFIHRESSRDEIDERKADMHDELSYLLLEGVISERGDEDGGEDSDLGAMYRFKLRRLLSWPNSKIRSERLLGSLPSSFLREHALLLGRLGRHEDALQILYSQENSLELALEYCDVRHERQQAETMGGAGGVRGGGVAKALPPMECAYIPLVKVALSSDPDSDRGTAAAIQVLALRRDSIDKSAALRLLPKNIPMSSVVRPFLIPAVVENESHVRKLTVASSLLRSRYIQLKQKLTEAQLKSQASLHSALALKRLNLGEPIHSSKPVKARPVHVASPHYPDVMLVKHFFPRYLVIQAQVLNNTAATSTISTMANQQHHMNAAAPRTLANVAFVIAESSDEALVPTMDLPLKTVPPGATGSAWCILAASPQRLDGAAFLTCELRFTVMEVDSATGTPLSFGANNNAGNNGFGRTYVEELQDIEV
ncbi:hypothetical protein ACHAXR_012918, partial [Thalassiosira sp. AJA248-18]